MENKTLKASTLEDQLKEIQYKLELIRAYRSVSESDFFKSKSEKSDAEIEVSKNIVNHCSILADAIENNEEKKAPVQAPVTEITTEDKIITLLGTILKNQGANSSVVIPNANPSTTMANPPTTPTYKGIIKVNSYVKLLITSNIMPTKVLESNIINIEDPVKVLRIDENNGIAMVIHEKTQARFHVPMDDIELIN